MQMETCQLPDVLQCQPITWAVSQTSLPLPHLQPAEVADTSEDWQEMMQASTLKHFHQEGRPYSAGSMTLDLKLMALKRRQLEGRRLLWGSWTSRLPRPNTCEGAETGAALHRLQSSPAAMMSSIDSPPQSAVRPATSYSLSRCSPSEPTEPLLETLLPCADPADHVRRVVTVLTSAKLANRLDVDWQAQLQAMNDARRLVRHHREHVLQHVHALLWEIVAMVEDLRSFVSKTALTFLLECSQNLGTQLDGELEYVVPLLLKKAGTASSGRDSFLAHQADLVLSTLLTHSSPLRFVGALLSAAATNKNPKVRCKIAAHLNSSLQGEHGQRVAVHATLPERVVHTAEGLMQDGLLETRLHAKQALAQMKRLVEQHGPPGGFNSIAPRLGSAAATTPRGSMRWNAKSCDDHSPRPSPPASPSKQR